MDIGDYLPLLLPLLAVPLVCWSGSRLYPALASWLTAVSSVVLAVGAALALVLFTIAGLAGLSVVARFGHLSTATLRSADVTDLPLDSVAGALLAAMVIAALVTGLSRARAIGRAYRLTRQSGSTRELLVLHDQQPIAHAVPGRPGRIIVSTSMLGPAERRALLAHERAHLTRSHHLFVAVVDVMSAANPLLRPLRKVVRYTTERWADEIAAGQIGDRAVVAKAVGKAALATKAAADRGSITGSITGQISMAAAAGEVPRRVAALLIAPPARRLRLILTSPTGMFAVVAIGITVASAGFAIEAAGDLHHVLALAYLGRYPRRADTPR
ncbi:MAG TPA: M56 family metallopeptidase [Pseudonocardiaceae bacterium]|jgi:hypothetical protein|nr:M56 family metallopeptidase [Pseudonocardiaceae bacterium]